ncbi:MAG: outer spore coat protein CotE [bacterium]|nr:outer spore coat protein CotE [bacterium]
MSAYKEIVTKAVLGKGKKYYKNTYSMTTEAIPTTVLGCWVINHLITVGDNLINYKGSLTT